MKPHTFRYRVMESDLPPSCRAVAHVLATRANYETGAVKVSVRKLSAWTGLSVNTVRHGLTVLTLRGWLVVLGQKHERASRHYRLASPESVSLTDTEIPVDNGAESNGSVSVADTACISDSHSSVSVTDTPIPLEESPRSAPTLPTAPDRRIPATADTDSRDAVVAYIARGMRLPR